MMKHKLFIPLGKIESRAFQVGLAIDRDIKQLRREFGRKTDRVERGSCGGEALSLGGDK